MNTLPRKRLPIGIQTLRKIREDNCYYVDKTSLAIDLVDQGSCYFLSRPRRFGKSLFLDTLKELFEGTQDLFTGLVAQTRWDWRTRYPVIRVSFSDGVLRNRQELDQRIGDILRINREALGLQRPPGLPQDDIVGNFGDLIRQAHSSTGQRAVVLIDEYDKPLLDNITDRAAALEMREGLKNLYSVIKGADPHLKFVFLTGVSKFSKVSLFSGLNNLKDITLDPRYSASIPHQWLTNNPIAQYEGYYASVFYSYFAALGLNITCEESSNAGRLDMAVKFNGQIYLFEFKVVELAPEGRALQQIIDKGYAHPHQASGQPIHLIGVEFSKTSRSVVGFEVQTLQSQ